MKRWRPSSGADAARRRAQLLRRLRTYFETTEALQVDTPALSRYAVSDPLVETIEACSNLTGSPLYLHTSPEFCMKRLLAAGYPDIFSVCRVFRDGESGRMHQPEFTMVEWYRLGVGLNEIVTDTVAAIAAGLNQPELANSVTRLDYRDAFMQAVGIDPFSASCADLADAANADSDLRATMPCNGEPRDDWLDLILATQITASFSPDKMTVLQHYPASQAALAQICPSDPTVADRFEVFIGNVEIANGYVELTDAVEQAQRIAMDQEIRKCRDRPIRSTDELLLCALESGLPACAGVAMGVERLQMIHDGTDNISNVVTFTFEDQYER